MEQTEDRNLNTFLPWLPLKSARRFLCSTLDLIADSRLSSMSSRRLLSYTSRGSLIRGGASLGRRLS